MAWLEPTKLSGSFKFAASASSPPMQAPIKARSRDGPGFLFGSAISGKVSASLRNGCSDGHEPVPFSSASPRGTTVIAGASTNERPRVASAGPDTGGKKRLRGSPRLPVFTPRWKTTRACPRELCKDTSLEAPQCDPNSTPGPNNCGNNFRRSRSAFQADAMNRQRP